MQDFINKWTGVGCDFDGWYGNQCVDLFNQYNQDVVGADRLFTPTTGGAADLWNDFAGPGNVSYRKIENTPDGVPQEGDVIIWAANTAVTGGAGHVAIATANCNVNSIDSFDQNYPTGSLPHVQHHPDYTGVLGWLRPLKNDTPVSAPVVEEVPQTQPEVVPSQPDSVPTPPVTPETTDPSPVVPSPSTPETSSEPSLVTPISDHSTITLPVAQPHTNGMDIKSRLTSRKLWIAVSAIITLILSKQYNQAVVVILGYLGAQGFVDASK